jgi:hypothetical protein
MFAAELNSSQGMRGGTIRNSLYFLSFELQILDQHHFIP